MNAAIWSAPGVLPGMLLGLLLACLIAAIWLPALLRRRLEVLAAARETELHDLRERLLALAAEGAELKGRLSRLDLVESLLRQREQEARVLAGRLEESLGTARSLDARLQEEVRNSAERLAFTEHLKTEFTAAFKALAGEVLEERSQRLLGDNTAQLGALLNPVREQLAGFQAAVQQAYVQETRERSLLAHEIAALKQLNQNLSQEALNLTRALRGDSQVQGAWGELVLERLLESSGLSAGREYSAQAVLRDADGGRPRPDIIIHLPEGRDLVIDAKVSLTAYERATASEGNERGRAMAEHLQSLRRHVDGLSRRDYGAVLEGRTLDFVLLFVPVESALIEAVRADGGLYEYALERQIALVSPSTLLVTLRSVAHLWKQEQRNRNAQEIALRAGRLYDKFVGFVDDLQSARQSQGRAEAELSRAFAKLGEGKGNLIRQAEQLRELGARHQKRLDGALLDGATETGDDADASSEHNRAADGDRALR